MAKVQKLTQLSEKAQNAAMENMIHQLIGLLGENADSETFADTPRNVREAWRFWTSGYAFKPEDILDVRPALAKDGDDMLVVRSVPIYSHCEKHLAPITGVAHIAFMPKKLTTGIANITRLVDVISRRIQTQQSITNELAEELEKNLKASGIAVVTSCQHMCMASRGGRNIHSDTIHRSFKGVFKNDKALREEFLNTLDL